MIKTTAFMLVFWLVVVVGWAGNIYKLVHLDFEAPYKAEIVRSLGVLPPVGAVVFWIDLEEEELL